MSLRREVERHLLPALRCRLADDPDYRAGRAQRLPEADGAWLLWSEPTGAPPLLLSPGLGAAPGEYRPLRRLFTPSYQLYRTTHPGTDRRACFGPLLELVARRSLLGQSRAYAALAVRARLHAEPLRERRLRQFRIAAGEALRRTGARQLGLVGHSYGTDTALSLALRPEALKVNRLVLFSPHPPGYLVPVEALLALESLRLDLVTGPLDRTADEVRPQERMAVLQALPNRVRCYGHWLDDLDHLAPVWEQPNTDDWLVDLREALEC